MTKICLAILALAACASSPTYRSEPNAHHATANGIELAYLEAGSGPLVLLLHGFPDTPHTWDAIAPRVVAAGFRVVMPFNRGYAPSAIPPADATVETLGRDVLGLIQALGEERAIVVGHDWGALAAYTAAALEPARVAKLVTIAIPHPIALVMHPDIPFAPHFMELVALDAEAMVRRDDFRYLDELVRRWSPTWQVPPGATDDVKNVFRAPGSLGAALGYYRGVGANLPQQLFVPMQMPALTFHGTEDRATDPRIFADQAKGFSGSFELVAYPVGHFVQLEATEEFTTKLIAFLRG
jgi:pimeloyl-ACP methyl ester carboxylesterase